MTDAVPFVSQPVTVQEDWIDYNGHLNMAYYNVIFDRGSDQALDDLGLGATYARASNFTIYTAEIHVCYVRELHRDDTVTVSLQLLDHDAKRLHTYQEIRHSEGWLAATAETLSLHVDMSGPKVVPFPEEIATELDRIRALHAVLPKPDRAGRAIGIVRKG
ncbi:MAG: thioesterase family protein [Methylobacterium mesophilicum]|nr:thioesterase family protein [Methylobacterium mesophilicum]